MNICRHIIMAPTIHAFPNLIYTWLHRTTRRKKNGEPANDTSQHQTKKEERSEKSSQTQREHHKSVVSVARKTEIAFSEETFHIYPHIDTQSDTICERSQQHVGPLTVIVWRSIFSICVHTLHRHPFFFFRIVVQYCTRKQS